MAAGPASRASRQVSRVAANAERFGVNYIVNTVIGTASCLSSRSPELGFHIARRLSRLACGDSHTSTHGAFGAVAFGIGSSEVECVLATQTLRQRKQKSMRVTLDGWLGGWGDG